MPATKFGNSQDLVDIQEIHDNTVVLKSGALRQIIMVGGINFALKSEVEQNIITQGYQNFLNGIDFSLQIIVHSRKVNIEKYLDGLSQYSSQETSVLLQNQAEEYREFIRGFIQKNAIMEKVFLVVVPFQPVSLPTQTSVENMIPFMKKKGGDEKLKEETLAHFAENLAQLKQRANQIVEGLFAIGLEAVILNDEQLVELFYNFYNPETIEKEGINLPKQ